MDDRMQEKSLQTIGRTAASRRILAVGGAKGGVGKSLLAANLAVYLSSRGHNTVAVDLDLGAANLHLYLGVWSLAQRINDFLDKKIDRLDRIAVETRYGPRLIGGGSSRLGAANLPFARKLKLMRAVRNLDADYVVIDLGGDTAYNILDFFLMADQGIVITTCDPAAYLDAYSFVKLCLHRRLTRLFSPESKYRKVRDNQLMALINAFVGPEAKQTAEHSGKIADLLSAVEREAPHRLAVVQEAVEQFQPRLLVNLAGEEQDVQDVVKRFQKVARGMLSIEVPFLGSLPADAGIGRSTRELVPEVASHPDGLMAERLGRMIEKLF